ncbi:MAG: ketopantoate reductase family protein [Hydrogenimonas sp.]|nr:ketopantoate reductase family protein [Hydrogenimonas sp.]
MKIGVVGAGGVGGFLAAMLSRSGEEIYLLARGDQLKAIEREGVYVELRGERVCGKPKKVSDKASSFEVELDAVLFCTKGYDLEEAARSMEPAISSKTLLVPLGNGVENANRLLSVYPDNPIANGAIYIVSCIKEPGVAEVKGKGAYLVVGCDGKLPKRVKELAKALEEAGLKVKVSEDITTEVWRKFLLISAMATLTSCYDEPMGAIVEKRGAELDEALREIMAVGIAEGAKLDKEDIERVKVQVGKVPFNSPTSMWLDFKAGNRTELEELTGYIVRRGEEMGMETPVMRRCYEELKRR